MPSGRPQFDAPWFKWFLPHLTLPEGYPMRWEGHLLLMTDEFFRPELQHLLTVIGKGNMKTTWEAALADWHLVTVKAPRVYAGAENLEQAKELFSFADHFTTSTAALSRLLTVKAATLEIRLRGGTVHDRLKLLAGDDSKEGGKKQGKNPTLALADEPHAYENSNLWVDLRSGGFKRRQSAKVAGDPNWHLIGKDCSITTAGHDINGPLGQELTKFLGNPKKGIAPIGTVEAGLRVLDDGSVEKHPDGRLTICRSPTGSSVALIWANLEDDDIHDMRVVKFANPASIKTPEALQDAYDDLSLPKFKAYHCCLWTEGFDSWLPDTAWPTLASPSVPRLQSLTWEDRTWTGITDDRDNPILEDEDDIRAIVPEFRSYVESLYDHGSDIVAALDMGRYRDTAAVVTIGWKDGRKVPRAIVWRNDGHNKPIRYEWPEVAILLLYRLYNLQAVAADPKYADQLAERLEARGVPMEAFPQSNERMGKADTELRRSILAGEFMHDGDTVLTAHVQAGRKVEIGDQLIVVKKQTGPNPPPIDALKALSMANAIAGEEQGSVYDNEDVSI